ncbi:GGDEF domain-containing protein [Caloramator sp. mosi_1]|uniref:GGDEF domain-containing protein n=1 Tax=Caloramator sp. mosi_1 TaxID=3023090 RepID=UPI003FCD03EE
MRLFCKKIKEILKDEGILFRFGEDEFLILFKETDIKNVENYIQKIIDKFNNIFELEGKEVFVTLSAGVYKSNKKEGLYEIIRRASLALYVSKNTGKSKLTIFQKKLKK